MTNCPVCSTSIGTNDVFCTNCDWAISLSTHPSFELELSRAKRSWHLREQIETVIQGIDSQNREIQTLNATLLALAGKIGSLETADSVETAVYDEPDLPILTDIVKCHEFDTPDCRKAWWNELEPQWKKAHNMAILQQQPTHQPSDDELLSILNVSAVRYVGPSGTHPNLNFTLTNLSGLKHLTDLSIVIATHHHLTGLEGIEHLRKLEKLFVNNNRLKEIKTIGYLSQVTELYCQSNELKNLCPVDTLHSLKVLYCCDNELRSFKGITSAHAKNLTQFVGLPNDRVSNTEVRRLELAGIRCERG